jgi:hypothetical protein
MKSLRRVGMMKVYLHNPTDGRCHTTRHTKNRINHIFVCRVV